LYRRAIGISICILLICATSSSVIGNKLIEKTSNVVTLDRNTLYVGGSGPNNYTKIQYAIDDANDGDNVFVYEGEYNELIYINTTISLIGENKVTTIINGTEIETVVTVNADNVNINGFTIEKSSKYDNGIEINSAFSNISNNIFNENAYGISIDGTDNHTITGNTFFEHGDRCIEMFYSHNNIISGNLFTDTVGGAMSILYCDFGIISDNVITWAYNGIFAGWCNFFIFTNNTIIGRGQNQGILLHYSENCSALNNIINDFNEGINLYYSNYNNIYSNEITNCDYDGVFFASNSNYNVISNNILSDNEDGGITMWDDSSNNTIFGNNIKSNKYGINIKYQASSNNNIIYHNNLIDNNVNANDGGFNLWNLSYPSGGNYWSDYTGEDNDGDGIGDTELNISGGGGNKDHYPLMHPWGEQRPVANYTYFEEHGGYIFNASISYDRDGEILSYDWDFGDGSIETGITVVHSYNSSGTFDVSLIVTDDEGYKGNHSKTIDAVQNYPPDTPNIDGPDSGGWGKPYHFTFQTSDNEGSDVWYFVDWGDGKDTGWMGPYVSGDEITDSHTWTEQETFTIRCKAKDMYNIHSDWGEFEITIPRTRISTSLFHLYELLMDRFPLLERLIFFL
jgi:parallel beta-helix repeat protein